MQRALDAMLSIFLPPQTPHFLFSSLILSLVYFEDRFLNFVYMRGSTSGYKQEHASYRRLHRTSSDTGRTSVPASFSSSASSNSSSSDHGHPRKLRRVERRIESFVQPHASNLNSVHRKRDLGRSDNFDNVKIVKQKKGLEEGRSDWSPEDLGFVVVGSSDWSTEMPKVENTIPMVLDICASKSGKKKLKSENSSSLGDSSSDRTCADSLDINKPLPPMPTASPEKASLSLQTIICC